METSAIAIIGAVTASLQAIGTFIVVKIQQNQIAGLRGSIQDQKASIDALKSQADGQVSITEQLRKLITDISTVYEKKISLIETTEQKAKEAIQEELARTKERLQNQLAEVKELDVPVAVTSTLTQMVGDIYSTKSGIAGLRAELAGFMASIKPPSFAGKLSAVLPRPEDFTPEFTAYFYREINARSLSQIDKDVMINTIPQLLASPSYQDQTLPRLLTNELVKDYMRALASEHVARGTFPELGKDWEKVHQRVGHQMPEYWTVLKNVTERFFAKYS